MIEERAWTNLQAHVRRLTDTMRRLDRHFNPAAESGEWTTLKFVVCCTSPAALCRTIGTKVLSLMPLSAERSFIPNPKSTRCRRLGLQTLFVTDAEVAKNGRE